MKIYLYNKYFPTLGGGEKDSCGIAEVLSKKHDVSILYAGKIDTEKAQKKLNLDLSKVNFIDFNDHRNFELDILKYVDDNKPDVFINATYFSCILSSAPVNISLIFFPKFNALRRSLPTKYDKFKFKLAKFLFVEYDKIVRFYEGFNFEEYQKDFTGRWTQEDATLFIDSPFSYVNIHYHTFRPTLISETIKAVEIHGNKLNYEIHKDKIRFEFKSDVKSGVHLKFNPWQPSDIDPSSKDDRKLGLFVTTIDTDALSVFSRIVLKLWRSAPFKKRINNLYMNWREMQAYGYIHEFYSKSNNIVISKYTDDWLKKMYGESIKSTLLFPPVDVVNFYPANHKSNIILCVGRFFIGGHNKKQIEMIKTFKKMYDLYPQMKNYEMHLCGGTHPEEHHQQYIKTCLLSAQGYPIKFHFDIKYSELLEVYSKASIFWHGSGMNEDRERDPDKFEHFGITTVEAMAAGCVPVVIGVAGQLEIVEHQRNGFLWDNEEELIAYTLKLIKDPELIKEISKKSIAGAQKFKKSIFDENVNSIFNSWIYPK